MNAPIIWMGLPACLSVLLWFTGQRRALTSGLGSGICLFFAALAWQVPIGTIIRLGFINFEISPNLFVLGRQFVISNNDRGIIIFLFIFGAFWFFGAGLAGLNRLFIPTGMALLSLSIAALSVEPFLYAALIVEIMVLISIPMLVIPGQRVGHGQLRFIIFQTLALPFILLAGWATAGVDSNPADEKLLLQAVILLGLGMAFWLAVFPFHSWLPLMMEETNPYSNVFLLSLLQSVAIFLLLKFLDSFAWLRNYTILGNAFLLIGTIMVLTSGIWAVFQTDIRRIIGYGFTFESGLSLLALGSGIPAGAKILIALFLSRILSFGLMALAITIIARSGTVNLKSIRGYLYKLPFSSLALVIGLFSTAGLPVLGGFPARLALLEALGRDNLVYLPWVFFGMTGLFLSGVRVFASLINSETLVWERNEKWLDIGLLVISITGLIIIGIFPNWTFPTLIKLLIAFDNLG